MPSVCVSCMSNTQLIFAITRFSCGPTRRTKGRLKNQEWLRSPLSPFGSWWSLEGLTIFPFSLNWNSQCGFSVDLLSHPQSQKRRFPEAFATWSEGQLRLETRTRFPPEGGGNVNTIRTQVNSGREKWVAGLWQSWTSTIQTWTNYCVKAPALKRYGYHADALKKPKHKKVRPTVAEWEMITVHAFIAILNWKQFLFQKTRMVQWVPSQLHVNKKTKLCHQNTNKRRIRSPIL